ncbi:MAG: hypothetical protein KDB01_02750 [Planctomycetaceae bacterium]|nr:hypothetical protein [Planctomycetaceae bacterium]
MNLHSRNLLLKAVLGSVCMLAAVRADAGCHGRSGGGSYGGGRSSYGGHSSHSYSPLNYHRPVYTQPVYPQPVYSQPVYAPLQPISTPPQPQPVYALTDQQSQSGPGPQGNPPSSINPTQQSLQTAAPSVQSNPMQVAQTGGFSGGQAPGSVQTGAAPNVSAPAPNTGTPLNSPSVDAQQSALLALGGFAPPQTAVQPATSAPGERNSFAGSWTANLPNGARVQLALQADGNFSWTAINKDGQSSVFQGSYAIENGGLSLTRNNDGQKLQGSMTLKGTNTFTFKLSAAQSSSLDFVRS